MPRSIQPRRHGLCLVEILVSLAIVALLLTATSIAFDAALCNYKENNSMNEASVGARNALGQICANLRASLNVPDKPIEISGDGNICTMIKKIDEVTEQMISYKYDPQAHTLLVNIDNGADWPVMLENVYPITNADQIFTEVTPLSSKCSVGRVEIRFRVDNGNSSRPVSVAVVPGNVIYSI